VILWLEEDPVRGTAETLESMIFTCSLLIAGCMWQNVPLRGAIAYGDFVICKDPVFFVGKPFSDAHALEQKQRWAGAVLAPSAVEQIPAGTSLRIVETDVPTREGTEKLWAVNWPGNSQGPSVHRTDGTPLPSPDWDNCFASQDERVAEKKRNTIAFFEANERFSLGVSLGPEFLGNPTAWRQRYRESSG
jgi:hypothetical protein